MAAVILAAISHSLALTQCSAPTSVRSRRWRRRGTGGGDGWHGAAGGAGTAMVAAVVYVRASL